VQTFNTVTAAAQCGGDVHVLVAGHEAGGAADAAAKIAGVAKVLHADARQPWPSNWPRTSPRKCWPWRAEYTHLLFPATRTARTLHARGRAA